MRNYLIIEKDPFTQKYGEVYAVVPSEIKNAEHSAAALCKKANKALETTYSRTIYVVILGEEVSVLTAEQNEELDALISEKESAINDAKKAVAIGDTEQTDYWTTIAADLTDRIMRYGT